MKSNGTYGKYSVSPTHHKNRDYQNHQFYTQAGEEEGDYRGKNYMIKEEKPFSKTPKRLNSQITKPLNLKYIDEVEINRLVLYKNDCHQIMPAPDSKK